MEKTMRLNEFARPSDDELFSEEDIAKVIDAEVNGDWVTRTPEEMIAHVKNLFRGKVND